ncbi:liver carboxylesterase-like [Styela clava]
MSPPIVATATGKIKGKLVELKVKDAKPVNTFRNVPFAKPPIGNLRFLPPQPAEPWSGIRDGTTPGNLPIYSTAYDSVTVPYFPSPNQFDNEAVLSEDCLHLSVYTPSLERGKNLPVMVYLYGGGFSSGSERPYDGCALAGMNDVVVVVPNYRVGVFGFFALGPTSICSGNAGLLDQQLALKWVKENIENFGGDANNVTLFGQSAGSVAVEMQVLSPLARGLFHKAISFSGQTNMDALFPSPEEVTKSAKFFLELLKIDEKDDLKSLEALQKVSSDDLMDATAKLLEKNCFFQPYVEGKVFVKPYEEMMKDLKSSEIPYIIGCNNTEGYGLLSCFLSPNFATGMTEEELKQSPFLSLTEEGFEKCKEFYIKDNSDKLKFSRMHGDMVGDSMYISKTIPSAAAYSAGKAPVYLLYGCFQLQMFQDEKYGPEVGKKPNWCLCDHGDDLFMTFGWPFSPYVLPRGAKFTKDEEEISRKFMAYVTNFARTGDPNKGRKVDVKWPRYKPQGEYLVVDKIFSVGKNLGEKEADFWNNVMPAHTKKRTVSD